jgi:hypothetical protein
MSFAHRLKPTAFCAARLNVRIADSLVAPASHSAMIVPALVVKMRQGLTFSATIPGDVNVMKTMAVITILALLTISGAVVSDQILTANARAAHASN